MYRSEKAGIELHRQRFEEAKATLEEMAERGNFNNDNAQLDSALTTLGFRKEELNGIDSAFKGYLFAYVRENEKGLEVLADHGYDRTINLIWKPHLYQIPAGKTVQEWYDSYKYTEPEKKRDISRIMWSFYGGVFGIMAGFGVASVIEKYGAGETLKNGILLTAAIAGMVVGCKIGGINEVIAKGPNALRYIKNNSTYKAPKLCIESKPRIIDEEFTDEKDTDQKIYQEQVREALAVTEAKQQTRVTRK